MSQTSENNMASCGNLSVLPEELLCIMTGFLDVSSLLQMRFVNKRVGQLASRNEAGWSDHCQRLWSNKVHISPLAKAHHHAMTAYRISIHDATTRNVIRMDELCYDIQEQTGTIWSFRFKKTAGIDWTGSDPWWLGKQARQMVLLPDGTVKRFIPENSQDPLPSTTAAVKVKGGVLVDPFGPMTWRFLNQPMDLPTRPTGAYVRFHVAGRDVPTYVVRRSPTNNWGFIMESCWGVYASFELPPLRFGRELRLRRTHDGARWVAVVDDSDMEEDDQDNPQYMLTDDSSFIVTNEVQWREALLYNFGARQLPEGGGARDEFDQTWGERLLDLARTG